MVSNFLTEVLLTVASYLGVFIVTIVAINWILGGLFKPYMRVRGSRGKFVLVKVKNIVSDYFVVGRVEERMLLFKDRKKEERRVVMPKPSEGTGIYRSIGVSCIDVDDEKNAIITYSNALVTGFDAVKFNDLYTRCLYKPALVDNKMMILIVLVIVNILAVIIVGILVYQNHKLLVGLGQITQQTITTLPK